MKRAFISIAEYVVFSLMVAGIFLMCLSQCEAEDAQAAAEQPTVPAITYQPSPEPTATPTPTATPIPTPIPTPTPTPTPEPETVCIYSVPLDVELQLYIIETCESYGIDPAIVFAMIERESAYQADVIGDSGNAKGLMQIWEYWHSGRMEKLGCYDLLDPYQNVTVGIDYLAEMLDWYGDIGAALTAYNAGSYSGEITYYAAATLELAATIGVIEHVYR